MAHTEDPRPPRRNSASVDLRMLLKDAPPAREDDTPVLMGQSGPRRRATQEELRAFVEEEWRRYASEQ